MTCLKFDVAKQNAFHLMANEEDKSFLRAQGEMGRRGSMIGGLDISLATEKRGLERQGAKVQLSLSRRLEEILDNRKLVLLAWFRLKQKEQSLLSNLSVISPDR